MAVSDFFQQGKTSDISPRSAMTRSLLPGVLYDISFLGRGYADTKGRTGIFRVVESLAYELARSEQCLLAFCATECQLPSGRYLADNPALAHIPFSFVRSQGILNEKYESSLHAVPEGSSWQRLYLRPLRKILYEARKAVHADEYPLDPASLAEADILHAPAFSISCQQTKLAKLQRFQTVYDLTPVLYPNYFGSDAYLHAMTRMLDGIGPGDWAVAISQATKDDLCNHTGIDPDRVFVTPLAADRSLFFPCMDRERQGEVRLKYCIPEGPYILSLCTLEPRKNLDHVIRCFARLVREQKIGDLNLVLAGGKGWLFDKIFAELETGEAAALKERIIVTGYVDNEDLAPLYSGALCFVYPSLYEGFGLPPLEAMQCGLPVITSNNSSLPEVVGDAGVMVDAKDEDALCQGILEIIQRPEWRGELAQKALARAAQFSWQLCADQTIAAYRTALASS